ncbi:MAG: TorF family putative porin [Methyloceanibacter sp.]|nr:TorF family putative porin [Methyloceanibacter sp.]
MARRSTKAGAIGLGILGVALIAGLANPALADDTKLTLTGSAVITSDYMFRSISNTNERPAVQPEFDLTYGMFYAFVWGSNTAFGDNIELDYGIGITPKWKDITFNFAGLYYTYPGENENIGYFELLAGASWTGGAWTLGVKDYWSPDNCQFFGDSNAIEGTVGYAFSKKWWNFFSPSVSGTVGFQSYEKNAADYTYWNAGLTLGFMDHWSADVRYFDTTYNNAECLAQSGGRNNCDARAVGTVKVTF